MTQDTKQKSKTLTKQNSKTQTQQGLQKPSKSTTKNRDRNKMHKTRQVQTRSNKTSDISNKLHVSTYIKTINGETNQHPNEKHTAKTYGTNITLHVKPQYTDINAYSLNQLEDDKFIYKPIHDSQKQTNTNRLININQTSERLKQTTVKKDLHKGKYRLVTMQQQKTNGQKQTDTLAD